MKKPRTCRAVEANVGARNRYGRELKKLHEDFQDFVLNQIMLGLEEQNMLTHDSAFDPKSNADKAKLKALKRKVLAARAKANPEELKRRIDKIISSNLVKWLKLLSKAGAKSVSSFVQSIVLSTSNAQRKALISAHFNQGLIKDKWTVPVVRKQYVSPEAAETMQEAIRDNVSLISKIETDDISRISDVITQGLTEGRNDDELRQELRNTQGFNEGRINRVVLDQTNKLNQAVQTANADSLGITEAVWVHVPGEYSSRDTHMKMNGKRFNIHEGLYDSDVNHNVVPGQLPLCRCRMRLIFKTEHTDEDR